MDATYSTNRKLIRMFANILSILAILTIAFPATGSAFAEGEQPNLRAFPDQNRVDGSFWPANQQVFLVINDDPFAPQTADGDGHVEFALTDYDLERGDTLTMSSGDIYVTYTARQLFVDNIDPDTETISGTVDGQQTVHVWTDGAELYVEDTDSEGNWSAGFSSFGDVIFPGACGNAEAWGENNANSTIIDWCAPPPPPIPWLVAYPENDAVEGWEWPEGTTVTLTINNATGLEWSGTAAVTLPGDTRTYLRIEFGSDHDLQVGDLVTLTDEFGTSTTHEVQPLSITDVDLDTNIVSGTADVGAQLQVWAHEQSAPPIDVTASDGTWQADLTEAVDITYGTGGFAWIIAEGGNATAVGWNAPPPPPTPFIAVSLTEHWFWVNNFMPETLVTFSIYENQGDESPILEFSKPTDALGNLTIEGWEHLWNPEPGDYIVATDGSITKDLVLEYITLDVFEPENDLVSGHALPGREVGVGVGNETGEQWMNVFADDTTGIWVADFTLEGFEFDVTEDSWAGGHVNDQDGDVTAAHNSGPPEPPARFTVFPEWDAIEGWNFPLGAVVHLAIDDPTIEGSPDYEQDETVTFTPWGSWELWVWFDLAGKYEVKAGDIVTLTYGETLRTHTVQNLAVTKVNQEDNIVKGIADAGAEVHVWPHATGQEQLAITNPQGKWNVDFTGIYDLMPGDGGRSEIRDEMGNATAVDWYVSKPRIVASITEDWFYLQEFSPDTTLDFTVFEAQDEKPIWKGIATTDGSGFAWINAEGRWDLEPGNYLVVSEGNTTKELVVEGFTFDVFNLSNGQLAGTAPEPYGRRVWVGIGWENDGWSMDVATNDTGRWFADFGQPVPSDYWWVAAQIFDSDGDASELRPSQIYPTLFAWLEWDQVDGHGWREGATVTLTIGDLVLTQVAGPTKLVFDVGKVGHDLAVGDLVQMSDGLITKELLIPDLKVIDYDLGANTVSGTYDPSLGFRTSVNGQAPIDVTFDGNLWTAYYDDLGPLMWGDAVQRDADSDEVAATIHTPNPNLYALPDDNKIYAQGWIAGFQLDLTIYDADENVIHSDSQMVLPPSVVPWTVVIFEGFDIEPNQRIVLSQRGYERELLVSSLKITGFNYTTQQVIGTGDPGADIFIRINGEDIWGKVGGDGNWAIAHQQLAPGVWGEAIQPDGVDGDETRDGFQAPF